MKDAWFRVEHHRLHSIEEWPDGPQKDAALASVRSAIACLTRNLGPNVPVCTVCGNRRHLASVSAVAPQLFQVGTDKDERAA